jgi:hypothetical protein
MPIDLVIDLGIKQNLSGFKYLPDQNRWRSGIITTFQFYVSDVFMLPPGQRAATIADADVRAAA